MVPRANEKKSAEAIMKVYRTKKGLVVEVAPGEFRLLKADIDDVINKPSLARGAKTKTKAPAAREILAPIGTQEVWAAGVTYFRSRNARMEESKQAGGGDFYSKVYDAERPELFFKAPPYRVVGPGQNVRIRGDSKWNVPEPELTLVISRKGKIVGYTIGNDMSSRDIEGENPLYLPQAKSYDGSCALGPCILLTDKPLPAETAIQIDIRRGGKSAFAGESAIAQIKRPLPSLVEFLFRETSFPTGAFLLTGTGIVPDAPFTLQSGDEVAITIPPIGTLTNRVK